MSEPKHVKNWLYPVMKDIFMKFLSNKHDKPYKGVTAVKNLEDYYLANKSPIEKVRNISQDKYDELIQAFKNKKKEILEKEVETITK